MIGKYSENQNALQYYEFLMKMSASISPKSAVEIGCRWGISAVAIMHGSEDCKVTSVDKEQWEEAEETIKSEGLEDRWTFVKMSSTEFWEQNHKMFDIALVDGDHSLEQTSEDIRYAIGYARFVVVDDYHHPANINGRFGVREAVKLNNTSGEFDIYPQANGFAVYSSLKFS